MRPPSQSCWYILNILYSTGILHFERARWIHHYRIPHYLHFLSYWGSKALNFTQKFTAGQSSENFIKMVQQKCWHTDQTQCSQMTFSKIRTNTVGKIRTDWKSFVLFFDMGIKLKDFASTIEIRHTFFNLTLSNYFININHIFKCNSIPHTHTVI